VDTGLRGKLVLVTGAATGMGRGMALAFADEGANVVVTDIDETRGKVTAAEVRGRGVDADFFRLDVADRKAVFDTVAAAEKRFGGTIDVLVNNAGILTLATIEEVTEADWDRVQAVNVKGPLFLTQAVVPGMRAKGGGRIVNICSVVSKMAGSLPYAHYSASKAAAWSLTMSAAREYASIPITVNGIAPGSIVNTDFSKNFQLSMDPDVIGQAIPMRRRGTPDDVVPAVIFLASEQARYITGELIDVNGGLRMD
jgi:NAD(P)-dependent dehydrogenase (short-subunit alcohol dehydrogenase family)